MPNVWGGPQGNGAQTGPQYPNQLGGEGISYHPGGPSDVWRDQLAMYHPSVHRPTDLDLMRQFYSPNRSPYAFDSRMFLNPYRIPTDVGFQGSRINDQLTARIGSVLDTVTERQIRVDKLVKGLADQQLKTDGTVKRVIVQQEAMSTVMKTIAEQQAKTDATVGGVVATQTVLVERMTKSDDVLQTILRKQTEMMSAITHIRQPNTDPAPAIVAQPTSGSKDAVITATPSIQEQMDTPSSISSAECNLIDEWHDGPASKFFPRAAVEDMQTRRKDVFLVHWAMEYPGGRRARGECNAESRRVCLGVIACSTGDCNWVARPQTKKEGRERQLAGTCNCGKRPTHITCNVVHVFRELETGTLFKSFGVHKHARPIPLHLSRKQIKELKTLSKLHPKATPSAFISGVPGPDGDIITVMDIADILINRDRVLYEIKKEKKKRLKEVGIFAPYSEFNETHPDFIIESKIGDIVVISVQTDFMATQIFRSMSGPNLSESVNGAVSDAAHKFFKELNAVLMATTLFNPVVRRWMPVIMSYMNGQTAAHYKCHFKTFFKSVHRICIENDIPFLESFFLMVLDFSSAQKLGFINAFIEFFTELNTDSRTPEQLEKAAEALLRGCLQHFNAQVARIRKTKALVPAGQENNFEALIQNLHDAPTLTLFNRCKDDVLQAFPAVYNWLEWWTRPTVAVMIFNAFLTMDQKDLDSLPQTTNPEESFHFAIYQAVGRDHDVMAGLDGLYRFANAMKKLHEAVLCGFRIRFGKAEPWKAFADAYGTTHPSQTAEAIERRKRTPNDGRPPDVVRKLLVRRILPTSVEDLTTLLRDRQPSDLASYRYKNNSCWLDTSLELLFRVAQRDPVSLERKLSAIEHGSILDNLLGVLQTRLNNLEGEVSQVYALTTNEISRDSFRKALLDCKIILSLTEQDALFIWLTQACARRRKSTPVVTYAAETYFFCHEVTIRYCLGNGTKRHVCLTSLPVQKRYIDLSREAHSRYKGRVVAFVKDFFRVRKEPEKVSSCWRPFCNHKPHDVLLCSAIVSHPICLRISNPRPYTTEVYVDADGKSAEKSVPVPYKDEPIWDFPHVIELPGIDTKGKKTTCHYDAIGRAVFSEVRSHFFAYVADPLKRCYLYDDLEKQGVLTRTANHKNIKATIAGQHPPTPEERTVTVVYHLREGVRGQEELLRWTQSELFAIHKVTTKSQSSSDDAPSFAIEDPLWREAKATEQLGGKDSDRESDVREYDYQGQPGDIIPITLKRSIEHESDIDERPQKRARFKFSLADSEPELSPDKTQSVTQSSPLKTPTPRARKRQKVANTPETPSSMRKRSKLSTPQKSPSKQLRKTAQIIQTDHMDPSQGVRLTSTSPKVVPGVSDGSIAAATQREAGEREVARITDPPPIDICETTTPPRVQTPRITRSRMKRQPSPTAITSSVPNAVPLQALVEPIVARKSGRPPKATLPVTNDKPPRAVDEPIVARKRGRPPKATLPVTNDEPRGRGRTPNAIIPATSEDPPKAIGKPIAARRRGRPPKKSKVITKESRSARPSTSPAQLETSGSAEKVKELKNNPKQKMMKYGKRNMRSRVAPKADEVGLRKFKMNEDGFESGERDDDPEDLDADGSPDDSEREQDLIASLNKRRTQASNEESEGEDSDAGPFEIKCRCGVVEVRQLHGEEGLDQDLIQCAKCTCWSHQACQYRGFTAFLRPKNPFFCHICRPGSQINKMVAKELEKDWKGGIPIGKRIRPGLGVLVLIGEKYWFPGRVIDCPARHNEDQMYTIKKWRLCESSVPGSDLIRVGLERIRDELWQDLKMRRNTRLGKFSFAKFVDVPVSDFQTIKSVGDVDAILRPHLEDLRGLATFSTPLDDFDKFPVLKYHFNNAAKNITNATRRELNQILSKRLQVVDTGILPADDEVHIASWMLKYLPYENAEVTRKIEVMDWYTQPAHTHAVTIVLAHRRRTKTLQEAFDIIINPDNKAVDVDAECIKLLERRMFEVSDRAGNASHYVWGRALGAHQGDWDPWQDISDSWYDKASECPAEDRKKSDGFSIGSFRKHQLTLKPPKPRMAGRKQDVEQVDS